MKSLKEKTVSGFKWLVLNNVLQKIISVGTFAILARILEPSTFGLFAMAFIAIDGLSMFKTFGFDGSIVQKKNCPEAANHTAFFTIQAMSVVLFIICFSMAPFLGHFFNNPKLASVVRALGVVLICGGFGRVPSAILTRNLRFRLISSIDLIGSTVNCFFAIIFAMISPTVWALVGAYVVKQIVMISLAWYFSGYRLKFQYDLKLAKELFNFGKYLMGLNILWYIGGNINNIVIGKLLGAAAVGYYALAANIGNVINNQFTHVISRVMFPAYSAIQGDREIVKRAYLKTIKYISILSLPFSMGLICLADNFVLTLYGEKWISIIPLIRLLGFVQMLAPIMIASGSLYRGCGKPEYDFRLGLLQLLFQIPLMIFMTRFWGLMGTVVSGIITSATFTPISLFFVRRITNVRFSEFMKQLLPATVCSMIMLISIFCIKTIFALYPFVASRGFNHFMLLAIFSSFGIFTYAVSFFFIDRGTTLEVKRMLFNLERV